MFYSSMRPISGNIDVNTLASKRSEFIGNAEILRMRRVIHDKSTCVCLRIPVAAITQKRRDASVDLWPALVVILVKFHKKFHMQEQYSHSNSTLWCICKV